MIMRTFMLLGLLVLVGTAYFVVVQQPPTFQAVPEKSEVARLQEHGILPAGPFAKNDEIEHGVFEVPATDEEMLEAATANMDMGGMDMGGMTMPDNSTMEMGDKAAPVLDMDMDGDGVMDMSSAEMKSGGGMQTTEGASADMGGMNMPATDAMGPPDSEEADRMEAGMLAGLMISEDGAFDREIKLSMTEWGFSNLDIDVKPGERIRFTLRNDGQILHEFMFMSMAGMQGVNYRARRADWNLLEHEALFEKSLMLPGEEISFVATIIKPGGWMFMCMLPYHMQMGMMGQMATEGMAMQM